MLYLDLAWRKRTADGSLKTSADLMNAITEGASQRIRPMLMTSLTLFISLLPIIYSSGSGADVMKRIAAPMLGGAGSTFISFLIVFPAFFQYGAAEGYQLDSVFWRMKICLISWHH